MQNLDTPYQHYGHYGHYEHYGSAMVVLQNLLMTPRPRPGLYQARASERTEEKEEAKPTVGGTAWVHHDVLRSALSRPQMRKIGTPDPPHSAFVLSSLIVIDGPL